MSDIEVRHEDADRFRVKIRGHELVVDQPVHDGGGDEGPTPTELFVAGLAACVAFYAGRFLRRHGLPTEGLAVDCGFAFADDPPARVGSVELRLRVPAGFPAAERDRLLAVVEHCTVHNSIRTAPDVDIVPDLAESAA